MDRCFKIKSKSWELFENTTRLPTDSRTDESSSFEEGFHQLLSSFFPIYRAKHHASLPRDDETRVNKIYRPDSFLEYFPPTLKQHGIPLYAPIFVHKSVNRWLMNVIGNATLETLVSGNLDDMYIRSTVRLSRDPPICDSAEFGSVWILLRDG